MARRKTGQDEIDILGFELKLGLLTIPNMALVFVMLIGLTWVIASILGQTTPIAGQHPLQTPLMILVYFVLIAILYTFITLAGFRNFVDLLSNTGILVIFAVLAYGLYLLGQNTDILAQMFSII